MAKDVGALRVIMASCAPPIRFPNVYGIDMPSRAELVAHGRTPAEVAAAIGADLVVFQTLPDLVASVRQFNPALEAFDCSVFTGEYVTGGVDEAYLARLERQRADNIAGGLARAAGASEDKAVLQNGAPRENGVDAGGYREARELALGCSGPMNGADDTIGLHNGWKLR